MAAKTLDQVIAEQSAKTEVAAKEQVAKPKKAEKVARKYPQIAEVKAIADKAIADCKVDYDKLIVACIATAICSNPAPNKAGYYPAVMQGGVKSAYRVITKNAADSDCLAQSLARLHDSKLLMPAAAYGWKSGLTLSGLRAYVELPQSAKTELAALALGYGAVQ